MNVNKMNFTPHSKVSICSTCLSSERKVFSLQEDQYAVILCKQLKLGIKKSANICWECRAMLQKVMKFKENALKAQCTLKFYKSYKKNSTKISTFSNLKIKKLDHVNYVHNIKVEEKITEECTQIDIKEEDNNDIKPDMFIISNEQPEIYFTDMNNIKNEEVAPNDNEISSDNFLSDEDEKLDDLEDSMKKDDKNNELNLVRDEVLYKNVVLNEKELMEHREICRQRLVKASYILRCDTCIVGFQTENALNAHNAKFHTLNRTPFKCSICETYFTRLGKLKLHFENHYNLYQCIECQYKSDKRPSVIEHYQRHHNKTWFSCRVCKQRFHKQAAMVYHRKTAHSEVECTVCGKILKERYTLKMHMLLHTGMPMYNCDICNKSYRGKWGIKAHMRTMHGKGAPNMENAYCTECNVQFRSVYIYNQHLKNHSKHVLERLFCDMCDKSFTTKTYLTSHIMLIHQKTSKHSCTICNQLFVKKSVMLRHIKYVHDKEEKPKRFNCSVCHKKFAVKSVLVDHLNLHTGERPYKCNMCEASFPNKGVLYRHKKFVHKMKKA